MTTNLRLLSKFRRFPAVLCIQLKVQCLIWCLSTPANLKNWINSNSEGRKQGTWKWKLEKRNGSDATGKGELTWGMRNWQIMDTKQRKDNHGGTDRGSVQVKFCSPFPPLVSRSPFPILILHFAKPGKTSSSVNLVCVFRWKFSKISYFIFKMAGLNR